MQDLVVWEKLMFGIPNLLNRTRNSYRLAEKEKARKAAEEEARLAEEARLKKDRRR